MKNKIKLNPFLRSFVYMSVLILFAIIFIITLYYYVFSIPEPEGLSLASWPQTFTNNFSVWMENEDGNIKVKDIGLDRLDEYGLWIQVIDENGREVFSHNKPSHYPINYTASKLISFSTSNYEHENTIFVSSIEKQGVVWNYIIGFPYAIGKYIMYYNGETVGRLSPVLRIVILFILCLISIFVFLNSFWISRHLGKITRGIGSISTRNYFPLKEKGVFGKIYGALNKMNMEIYHSDKVQKDTERVRKEWIANITHDLKTPLSPVKGYAELLVDSPMTKSTTVKEYSRVILKNVINLENLINDLKLTYQLESGAIPITPQEIQIVRYVKELVIDVVNDPFFKNRNIEFESNMQEITIYIVPDLFRRAVQNIIINALTHNPPETKVSITVDSSARNRVKITITDNGVGMSDVEQYELFNRYYRGTNTEEKPEGSGLGLAIAKQIVTLHNGDIIVNSKLNEGTQFTIDLPLDPLKL